MMRASIAQRKLENCARDLQEWVSGIHSFHVKTEGDRFVVIFHSTQDIRDSQKEYTESFKQILENSFDDYLLESEVTDGLLKLTITLL